MKIKLRTLLICSAVILSGWLVPVHADVPQLINYQGKLTDGEGHLLEGSQAVTFSLFTGAEGGESLWIEEHPAVAVTHGLFNVLLGSVETDTLGAVFREQPDLFLEISVNGVILSPRQRMTSVGYALSTYGISVESGRLKDNTGFIMPAGTVVSYAGSSAPQGWLLCDGSAVSRATYADLFAVLDTSYGSGDGSTSFNLPDFRGNVPVGRKAVDGDFDTLGKTGGAKTHQLTTTELPSHVHSVDPPSTTASSGGDHSHNVNPPNTATTSAGAHSHSITMRITHSDGTVVTGEILNTGIFWGTGRDRYTDTADWVGDHQHWLDIGQFNSGNAGTHSHTVDIDQFDSGATGSGEAHNILQPYQVINFIIKY